MAQQQPIVTRKNVENELDYWLSQMPPHQLLEIIANKFDLIGRTSKDHSNRLMFTTIGSGIEAISQLTFMVWNKTK